MTHNELLALLRWQFEVGVTETIGEEPINRYKSLPEERDYPPKLSSLSEEEPYVDPIALAKLAAESSETLKDLNSALERFEGRWAQHFLRGARSRPDPTLTGIWSAGSLAGRDRAPSHNPLPDAAHLGSDRLPRQQIASDAPTVKHARRTLAY